MHTRLLRQDDTKSRRWHPLAAMMAVAIGAGAALLPEPGRTTVCDAAKTTTVSYRGAGTVADGSATPRAGVFVVSFAPNSAELGPPAEGVLQRAASDYAGQGVIRLEIVGGEAEGAAPQTVTLDRLAVTTAYLVLRDVPGEAIRFEDASTASIGCSQRGA